MSKGSSKARHVDAPEGRHQVTVDLAGCQFGAVHNSSWRYDCRNTVRTHIHSKFRDWYANLSNRCYRLSFGSARNAN
jgi:hypothetical protein